MMNTTPTAELFLKQDVLGRVRTPKERREQLLDEFYEHIYRKATYGIPYAEAVQLMFWMFLTLGYIPTEFRELELSKANLGILFSRLSRNGKIIISHVDNVCADQIACPEHWENLVEGLLQKQVILDETFPHRCGRYV